MKSNKRSGFTILEVLAVTAIIGVLSVMGLKSLRTVLKNRAITAEQTAIAEIAGEIQRSFLVDDWTQNIAAINGYPEAMGGSATATLTVFGSSSPADSTGLAFTAPGQFWAAKVSRARGDDITVGGSGTYFFDKNTNGPLRLVAVNAFDQPRWLITGPTTENNQRYILMSLIANPDSGLVIPAPPADPAQYLLWFNAIWSASWTGDSQPPPLWSTLLSTADFNQWKKGEGKSTNCDRLVVKTFVQKKFTVTLNQNAINTDANVRVRGTTNALITTSSTGTYISPIQVLAGRWLNVESRVSGSGSSFTTMDNQIATSPVVFTMQN